MMTRDEFCKHVRHALHHLHDPTGLLKNPLANLLEVADRPDAFSALQKILIKAIDALKPGPEDPPTSHSWRIYDSLYYRYVEGASQEEVADQLGIGVRHLRREQHAAVETLARRLWTERRLGGKTAAADRAPPSAAETGDTLPLSEELAWLKERPCQVPADLNEALPGALELARPLAEQYQVTLEMSVPEALPQLAAHPVALGQTLLTLLSLGIQRAPGGRVTLSARSLSYEVEIRVQGTRSVPGIQRAPQGDALHEDMARQLAALCDGSLTLAGAGDDLGATLLVPILERLPVLVIDDNADALQLLERYSAGTRYHLVGTRDPGQALALAQKLRPRIVVLDVMMPQVDGWKVLGQLRQHPHTSHVPVLICTILAHEELALSLGASGFIRKPVSRQAFLAALDRQLEQTGTASW